MYYLNKIDSLKNIFGSNSVSLGKHYLAVNNKKFPIIDDVIILLEPALVPDAVKKRLSHSMKNNPPASEIAEDIQFTFGAEWKKYHAILPEHQSEFQAYFDLVDIEGLKDLRVCDLGCGIGRWSHFLRNKCRELVLVDFSESIFIARKNLRESENVIFIMADIRSLPLKEKFADFLFCLGVLHHLPVNALHEVRRLKRYCSTALVYLYYSLDNRPFHFRILLSLITVIRRAVSRNRNEFFRTVFTYCVACFIYLPLIKIGEIFSLFKISHVIPIYDGYRNKSLLRIRQDVYDRFFTRIEQRFSRKDILSLKDTFENVTISEYWPYWHFLCKDVT
jgi:SAM-dependent methyltransferase